MHFDFHAIDMKQYQVLVYNTILIFEHYEVPEKHTYLGLDIQTAEGGLPWWGPPAPSADILKLRSSEMRFLTF